MAVVCRVIAGAAVEGVVRRDQGAVAGLQKIVAAPGFEQIAGRAANERVGIRPGTHVLDVRQPLRHAAVLRLCRAGCQIDHQRGAQIGVDHLICRARPAIETHTVNQADKGVVTAAANNRLDVFERIGASDRAGRHKPRGRARYQIDRYGIRTHIGIAHRIRFTSAVEDVVAFVAEEGVLACRADNVLEIAQLLGHRTRLVGHITGGIAQVDDVPVGAAQGSKRGVREIQGVDVGEAVFTPVKGQSVGQPEDGVVVVVAKLDDFNAR